MKLERNDYEALATLAAIYVVDTGKDVENYFTESMIAWAGQGNTMFDEERFYERIIHLVGMMKQEKGE